MLVDRQKWQVINHGQFYNIICRIHEIYKVLSHQIYYNCTEEFINIGNL